MEERPITPSLADTVEHALEEILCLAQVTLLNGNFHKMEGLVTAAGFIADALGSACPESTLKKLAEMEEVLHQQDKDSGWVI